MKALTWIRFSTVLSFGLGLVAGSLGHSLFHSWDCPLAKAPVPHQRTESGLLAERNAKGITALRDETWILLGTSLAVFEEDTLALTDKCLDQIHHFFDERKERIPLFCTQALGWEGTWKALTSRAGQRQFIKNKFQEIIFTQDELNAVLEEALRDFQYGLQQAESQLLVRANAEVLDSAPWTRPSSQSSDTTLSALLNEVSNDANDGARQDLALEVTDRITTEALKKVITLVARSAASKLGISVPIVTAGASGAAISAGGSLIFSLILDSILDKVITWFDDPKADLQLSVGQGIDDLWEHILYGDEEAWRIHARLLQLSQTSEDLEVQARAISILTMIESGGDLGLRYELNQLAQHRSERLSAKVFFLVYGEERQ